MGHKHATHSAEPHACASYGFSSSKLGKGGMAANGMNIDLVGAKYSFNPFNDDKFKSEYTVLGKNTETGVQTTRLGGGEANYTLHGAGFELSQETAPTGQVTEITKKSITLYGVTFEWAKGSDGSWSNELKVSKSWYRSLFLGVKGEASISLVKESYKPNK